MNSGHGMSITHNKCHSCGHLYGQASQDSSIGMGVAGPKAIGFQEKLSTVGARRVIFL